MVLQRGTERSAMFIETEVIEDTEGKVRMQRLAHQMGATMTTSVRYLWRDDGTVRCARVARPCNVLEQKWCDSDVCCCSAAV
eukprot:SAG11_NODE_142_length_14906_cov_8.352333_19_plen_82_part_00